jgi:alpha,alpha-trehalose-phosphate synthase [UDP-forming]
MNRGARLVVVSNRLPITVSGVGDEVELRPSSGGLVTALVPLLDSVPATWIGWAGTHYSAEVEKSIAQLQTNYRLAPVYLTACEREKYYLGFCNQVLWPLFHDMHTLCKFDPAFWSAYQSVNEKFADKVTENATPGDLVWVHDYHLMLVGECLKQRHLGVRVAYFHHIPFPAPDIFANLPSGRTILRAMLRFDRVGFQTQRDKHNFIRCVRDAFGQKVKLRRIGSELAVQFAGSCSVIMASAASIDSRRFGLIASSPGVKARLAQLRFSCGAKRVLLGVDRLDYTKGIGQRLAAFRLMLQQHPELHGNVVLLQLIVPSREEVPQYAALRIEIERQISEINGRFGRPDWTPVVYLHNSVCAEELVALYRLAAVMLVTSLKDGMNLVAKEYCACKLDQSGVLVLSQFAGAAQELQVGALVVNPYDIEEVVHACMAALNMSSSEARTRMAAMQRAVIRHDTWQWLASVSGDGAARQLSILARAELLSSGAVA